MAHLKSPLAAFEDAHPWCLSMLIADRMEAMDALDDARREGRERMVMEDESEARQLLGIPQGDSFTGTVQRLQADLKECRDHTHSQAEAMESFIGSAGNKGYREGEAAGRRAAFADAAREIGIPAPGALMTWIETLRAAWLRRAAESTGH